MKIALVVYQFIKEKGCVESYVFDLSRQLLDRSYEIHVFAHRFRQDQEKSLILRKNVSFLPMSYSIPDEIPDIFVTT